MQRNRKVRPMYSKKRKQKKFFLRGLDDGHRRQNFKAAIINMFKELKESILKELKEDVIMMSHQIENIEDVNYKIELNGNSRVENIMTEMKISLRDLTTDLSWQKKE